MEQSQEESLASLDVAILKSSKTAGALRANSRYHKAPRTIDDDYTFPGDMLGSRSRIYLARSRYQGPRHPGYAVKSVDLTKLDDEASQQLATRIALRLELDHPFIARLVDAYEEENRLHLVTEFMRGGELLDRLACCRRLSEDAAREALWQMLAAVNYLHFSGYVHHDLRLEHFLYEDEARTVLKLVGFGSAAQAGPMTGFLEDLRDDDRDVADGLAEESTRRASEPSPQPAESAAKILRSSSTTAMAVAQELAKDLDRAATAGSWRSDSCSRRFVGGMRYMAPEVARPCSILAERRSAGEELEESSAEACEEEENVVPELCDLWSIGVLAYVLLTGKFPFKGKTPEEQVRLVEMCRLQWPLGSSVSSQAYSFVAGLLKTTPSDRMTAAQALRHPWLQNRARQLASLESVDRHLVHSLVHFSRASVFRRVCCQLLTEAVPEEDKLKAREAFLELDVEHRGTIGLQHFSEALHSKFSLDGAVVKAMFEAMDIHNHQEVSYSELLAAIVHSRVTITDGMVRASFNKLDKDGNRVVDEGELRKALMCEQQADSVLDMLREEKILKKGEMNYESFIRYFMDHDCPPAPCDDEELQVKDTWRRSRSERNGRQGGWWGIADCCSLRRDREKA